MAMITPHESIHSRLWCIESQWGLATCQEITILFPTNISTANCKVVCLGWENKHKSGSGNLPAAQATFTGGVLYRLTHKRWPDIYVWEDINTRYNIQGQTVSNILLYLLGFLATPFPSLRFSFARDPPHEDTARHHPERLSWGVDRGTASLRRAGIHLGG